MIPLAEGIILDDAAEVEERFVRAFGPGGRNPNKEATAVELRLDVSASSLRPEVKQRLIELAGRAVTAGGVLVVVSRVHRSQAKNREAARTRLITLLQRAAKPLRTRRPTKPSAAGREHRLASKKFEAGVKKSRRRLGRREE